MVDVRLLTFLTLLEEKSYTKTAKKLYITQPAVTHHIKSIEKEKEITIFKDNKSFELTPAGILLKEYALIAKHQYSLFETALNRQSGSINARVAVTPNTMFFFDSFDFSELLKNSGVNVSLFVNDYNTIINGLYDGTIDFAVIDNSFDSSVLDSFTLKTANIILVCNPHGQYIVKDRITRDQLSAATLILSDENSGLYKSTINMLEKKNIKIKNNIKIRANSTEFMIKQIIGYDAIGFMYEEQALPYIRNGIIKKIDLFNFYASQNIYLTHNRSSFLADVVVDLMNEIKRN